MVWIRLLHLGVWMMCFYSFSAEAEWHLQPAKSALYFTSLKNGEVMESHTFSKMVGKVDDTGYGTLSIDLSSVETNVAIRNQRVCNQLFNVKSFSTANVALNVAPNQVLTTGIQSIAFTLDLHGIQKALTATVAVSIVGNSIQVATVSPILIDSAAFDLTSGINTLREIAGLKSIAGTVPVTFFLRFDKS